MAASAKHAKAERMAALLCGSDYFINADGCRRVDFKELTSVFVHLLSESYDDLKNLYKYHPSTIEMAKEQQKQCSMFNDNCDCYLPDIDQDNVWCVRAARERAESRKTRNYKEYLSWRTAVFERDDYTCQKCGQRGGTLNAHHIKEFSKHPKLRTDINNGITYCEQCHKEIHHV